jgi:hypothetical protein
MHNLAFSQAVAFRRKGISHRFTEDEMRCFGGGHEQGAGLEAHIFFRSGVKPGVKPSDAEKVSIYR